jgi:hypothetical protein
VRYTIYMAGEPIGTCALDASGALVIDSAEHAGDIRGLLSTEFHVQAHGKDFAGFFSRLNRYLHGYICALPCMDSTPPCPVHRYAAQHSDPSTLRALRDRVLQRRPMPQTA